MSLKYIPSFTQVLCALAVASLCQTAFARSDKSRSGGGSFGPRQGVSAQADHVVNGAQGSTSASVSGPKGKKVLLNSESTVTPLGATGSATVETSGGRSATATGQATVRGNTVSGSGEVQTSSGRGASATGSATKTDDGVQGQAQVSTNSGKSLEVSGSGTQAGGSVTVTGEQGSKTVKYGDQRQ